MQFRTMMFAATSMLCVALGSFKPGPCLVDSDCHKEYFCDKSVGECHACLSCQKLMREPPPTPKSCIKSVTECGLCLKGLVADLQSDLSCMTPETNPDGDPSTQSNTILIVMAVVAVLLLIGIVGVVVYYVTKFKKSPGGNDDTVIGTTLRDQYPPTAPTSEAPPPYWAFYQLNNDTKADEVRRPGEDRPLIPLYHPPEYESPNYQNTSVYNPPNYVRVRPPIYSPATEDGHSDENDSNSPSSLTAENTSPSARTPEPQNDTEASPAMNDATPPRALPERTDDENAPANESAGPLALVARNTELIQRQPLRLQVPSVSSGLDEASDEDDSEENNAHGASAQPPWNACMDIVISGVAVVSNARGVGKNRDQKGSHIDRNY